MVGKLEFFFEKSRVLVVEKIRVALRPSINLSLGTEFVVSTAISPQI
jgi:hypothetical protein